MHFAEAGHPVIGDPLYGRTPREPGVKAAALAIGRQALHAAVLGFVHPVTGEALRFETAIPTDMATLVAQLKGRR